MTLDLNRDDLTEAIEELTQYVEADLIRRDDVLEVLNNMARANEMKGNCCLHGS
jgi:hypothetical protein